MSKEIAQKIRAGYGDMRKSEQKAADFILEHLDTSRSAGSVPDSTGQKGRPYPYMIFRNMEALGIDDVHKVLKVGDTASDIKEGKHAGVWSAGVVIGSSEMGLSEEEYQALSPEEQEAKCKETEEKFYAAGADLVFRTLQDLAEAL